MAVIKISSCRVSMSQMMMVGNQAARFFFSVLFFIYFPIELAGGHIHSR